MAVDSAFYSQDVATLQYRAPRLAVDCLTQALSGPPHTMLILDVACGTGLVAAEVRPFQISCPLFSPLLALISCHPLTQELCLSPQTHRFQILGLHPLQGPLPSLRCRDPAGQWQV